VTESLYVLKIGKHYELTFRIPPLPSAWESIVQIDVEDLAPYVGKEVIGIAIK
jgi:hypothetical protein